MRILHVIHDFVPNHVAGSELYCYYLSGALAARRHSVHVLFTELDCSRPQYAYRRFERGALTCHEVVHNREYRTFAETYLNAHMDARFEQLLDAEMPDVVHLHHLMHHSLNYPKLAKARGIPVVFTLHDYWLSCLNYGQRLHSQHGVCEEIDIGLCADCVSRFPVAPPLATAFRRALTRRAHGSSGDETHAARETGSQALLRGAKAIYRGVMKRLTPATSRMVLAARRLEAVRVAFRDVDLFLAPSIFLAERMIEFGLPSQRVVHSPNGMRDDLLQIHTRKAGDRLRFGYVGSVAPHKGVHVLVEAFTKLAERSRCPVELRIHGNLTQRPEYVSRLRTLAGTAPIVFLGEFDNAVAGQVYAEMDALVIPSIWWENAPLTLFEARLAGKPIIASDGGSLPDLIDSHDTLFKQGDADDLARCLAAFADRPRLVSPTHARRVKTIEQDAREMEQRYESLLAAAPLPYESAAVSDVRS